MKFLDKLLRLQIFNVSLRIKITMIFIIPVILTMLALSYFHIQNERTELQALIEANAIQMSDVAFASLTHAMEMNDKEMLTSVFRNIKVQSSIVNMRIVAANNDVYDSTDSSEIGKKYELSQSGCIECHKFTPANRPHAMRLQGVQDTLRVVSIITNGPECQKCHSATQNHLGVLLIDTSLAQTEKHLQEDMIFSIGVSFVSILVVMTLAYLLIQWLIVRRVEVIRSGLMKLGKRDFSARIIKDWHTKDELTQLGNYFNQIAANLETLQAENDKKERVRSLAIIEERERIARELHDGVAQFLAYLSAKIGATRMELKNNKNEAVEKNLQQVEQTILDQSIEVRSSIIGLKMAGDIEKGLVYNVREFIDQCNRLDDMVVELYVSGDVNEPNLDSEKKLQLLRILQEAVSNIRKHAKASEASVRLELASRHLSMTISDNGVGFDPLQLRLERTGHFGLQIIFERAHEIGAHAEIRSAPFQGTTIMITKDIPET